MDMHDLCAIVAGNNLKYNKKVLKMTWYQKIFIIINSFALCGFKISSQHTLSSDHFKIVGKKNPVVFFSLNLSPKDQNFFHTIRLTLRTDSTNEFNYYGKSIFVQKPLHDFFTIYKLKETKKISHFIHQIMEKILLLSRQESGWLCIRLFDQKNSPADFEWHYDKHYFVFNQHQAEKMKKTGAHNIKIAFTLQGPSTFFYIFKYKSRHYFNQLSHINFANFLTKGSSFNHCIIDQEKLRNAYKKKYLQLNHYLNDSKIQIDQTTYQPDNNTGAIFTAGPDWAPVHSSPPYKGSRIFVFIVPGTNGQIQALQKHHHA